MKPQQGGRRPGEDSLEQEREEHKHCRPLEVWFRVCSGSVPQATALQHLLHADACTRCGPLLVEARAYLDSEPTAEEEARLDALLTSSHAGQMELADRLHKQSRPGSSLIRLRARWSGWKGFTPVFAWCTVAACSIAALIIGFLLVRPPSDLRLLAQAYDEQRSSELRLPGSKAVPLVSPTRGATTELVPRNLLALKLDTQEKFDKRPNDPKVRQMLGLIALVQHDPESARRNFEMAQALEPSLPGLKFDLASAEFELAESGGPSLGYARAVDLFSQHLHDTGGKDPVALFDRGLCWERLSIYKEAVADFQAALTLEKDPSWRREIQQHLDKVKRSSAAENVPNPQQDSLEPAVFLARSSEQPGDFEVFQSVAIRTWLPRRGTSPTIDQALQKLAQLGAAHHDAWISDMLLVPASDQQRAADGLLAQAVTASLDGNSDLARSASEQAVRAYEAIGAEPGFLRAAAEHVYVLQRTGQNQQCLEEASALERHAKVLRYAWLHAFVQLETGAASAMLGDARLDRFTSSNATAAAREAGLDLLALRGMSFVINDDVWLEHYQAAWDEATAALRSSSNVNAANMPRYQLLYGLRRIAEELNLPWTQAGLADAAASAARNTTNKQTAAYAAEELALNDLQIGDLPSARVNFKTADALLSGLGNGLAARRYAADWKTDRALLEAQKHGPRPALQMLEKAEPTVESTDTLEPRLHFYTEYANLLRESQDTNASLQKALKAVGDAERQLGKVHSEADRHAWRERTRKAYEVLVVDLAADTSDPGLSLRAWEWMQSAPYREQQGVFVEPSRDRLPSLLPPLPAATPGQLTLIFARVLDGYIGWSISADPKAPVRIHRLAVPKDALVPRVNAFLRLCADRRSSKADLNVLGATLYTNLFAPFQDQIAQAHTLRIDIDRSLASLPFAALLHDGRYLGLEHALVLLPNWWILRQPDPTADHNDRLSPNVHMAILREPARSSAARIPDAYDESSDVAALFPQAQISSARLLREGASVMLTGSPNLKSVLLQADLLHYVGHGLEEETPKENAPQATPSFALTRGTLPRCRLAVLAACRTVRETQETAQDVPSFARLVLGAGAGHVIATQWDVDSEMTRRLMLHFYQELAKGQTFDEALLRAQQSLQADPTGGHPYFWSGFQLLGQ